MPASETFSYLYDFDFTNPTSTTTFPAPTSGTFTIVDSVDGGDDNQTGQSGPMHIDSGAGELPAGSVVGYIGTTQAGDPIVEYNGQYYVLSNDPALEGTEVGTIGSDPYLYCFAAGTMIRTPEGETAVERLKEGDLVTTAEGRSVAVKWIGRQTLSKLFTQPERYQPVRVQAGALGENLPHADLVLTADHALIVDGFAITAGALVNGTTIAYDPHATLPDRVTYYHVETDAHDIILANGAAAETFVDYVTRQGFDNYAEYEAKFGNEQPVTEMDYTRISSARLVPTAIKARLAGLKAA